MEKKIKYSIRKGDKVVVIAGDDKKKVGEVMAVDREKGRVMVQGVNVVKRHTKPNAKTPNGGIIEKEAFINISNVMLVDPKGGENGSRIRRERKDGKTVRIAKKSGEVIK